LLALADVLFARKSPLALLGLDDEQRTDVDHEFAGFGWSELAHVVLADDRDRRELEDAFVLALHTPDEPDEGDALELAFWIGDDVELRVPWLAFADAHVRPLLRAEHRDVVLALCNPQHRAIERPSGLGDRRLHWADGDVTSWLDPDGSIRLQATRWHCR
jgi:hypothetical protein